MARGKPKLATLSWMTPDTKTNLRLYEMDANNVFQEVAQKQPDIIVPNTGLTVPARLSFIRDSEYLVPHIINSDIAGAYWVLSTTNLATLYTNDLNNQSVYGGPNKAQMVFETGPWRHILSRNINGLGGARSGLFGPLANLGPTFTAQSAPNGDGNINSWSFASIISRNARFFIIAPDDTGTGGPSSFVFRFRTSSDSDAVLAWDVGNLAGVTGYGLCSHSAFTLDETRYLHGSSTGILTVFNIVGTVVDGYALVRDGSFNLGNYIHKIVPHPTDAYISVGYATGGGYATAIYAKAPLGLQLVHTIPGIGLDIQWTADGKYLIDAALGKALNFDLQDMSYVNADEIMVNVITTDTEFLTSAISTHNDSETSYGRIYDEGFQSFFDQSLDYSNFKIYLVSNAYVFDSTHQGIASIAANVIIGPEDMENVDFSYNPTTKSMDLTSDNVMLYSTTTTAFRYIIILDGTNNILVSCYDYGGDFTTLANYNLHINLSEPPVRFS